MIFAVLPSMTATHEFVVPGSMPLTAGFDLDAVVAWKLVQRGEKETAGPECNVEAARNLLGTGGVCCMWEGSVGGWVGRRGERGKRDDERRMEGGEMK
jgi:hypothetical protein